MQYLVWQNDRSFQQRKYGVSFPEDFLMTNPEGNLEKILLYQDSVEIRNKKLTEDIDLCLLV